MWRAYGAPEFFLTADPALTRWANFCRTSGASEVLACACRLKCAMNQMLFKWGAAWPRRTGMLGPAQDGNGSGRLHGDGAGGDAVGVGAGDIHGL
jgi:hypothetical protein